jgi:hypothetical protein
MLSRWVGDTGRIYAHKRDEVAREICSLHNLCITLLRASYFVCDLIILYKMNITFRKHEWITNTHKFLFALLVRYRNGQKNNTKMDYIAVG